MGEGVFSVSGKANIGIVRDLFGRGPEEEEFTTVGGFLASRLGHIPRPGETFTESDLRFTVEEADRRRVYRVRIEPVPSFQLSSQLSARDGRFGPAESRPLRADRLKTGSVAVVGRPNAGKSTLVNALVGEKVAIVSDKPQTTRKRILGVARRPGAEIALVDTPGIHRPEYRLNAAMVHDAKDALGSADLVLFVVDAAGERGPGERYIADLVAQAGVPAVLVPNKIDRIAQGEAASDHRGSVAKAAVSRKSSPSRPEPARTWSTSSKCSRRSCRKGKPAYPEDFLDVDARDGMDRRGHPREAPRADAGRAPVRSRRPDRIGPAKPRTRT